MMRVEGGKKNKTISRKGSKGMRREGVGAGHTKGDEEKGKKGRRGRVQSGGRLRKRKSHFRTEIERASERKEAKRRDNSYKGRGSDRKIQKEERNRGRTLYQI